MSPTPVTTTLPTTPASYSWEATDEAVAARYGLDVGQIVRFDLNTSPAPPQRIAGLLAAANLETPLSEYPPSDYRRLVAAASARYGVPGSELLVGAGADEILDIIAKAFIPSGGAAVVPTPTYAMYHVLTDQRGARTISVPRMSAVDGYRLDVAATAAAAVEADLVWLCSPNNPTGLEEPDGAIRALLESVVTAARTAGRDPATVVLDEAYAEFTGRSLAELRLAFPNLVVIRTLSKAYALAGIRVGFAIARPEQIERMAPYRPPGSLSVVSVMLATAALTDPSIPDENLERVVAERARLADGLRRLGWPAGPSVTNFILVPFRSRAAAGAAADGLMRRGLVPRSFGPAHPLADHLRITVRSAAENDRLLAAAAEIGYPDPEEARP